MDWYQGKRREPLLPGRQVTLGAQDFIIPTPSCARWLEALQQARWHNNLLEAEIAIAAVVTAANYLDMTSDEIAENLTPAEVRTLLTDINGDDNKIHGIHDALASVDLTVGMEIEWIGGGTRCVPLLDAALIKPFCEEMLAGRDVPLLTSEGLPIVLKIVCASMRRKYPTLNVEELAEHLSTAEIRRLWPALLGFLDLSFNTTSTRGN